MSIINENLGRILFVLSVVAGLAFGWRDLMRLSGKRIAAIASVVRTEAVRRRVFWVTPLAFAGVVVVSQLQKPMDEQDALRQTIKFCVFATGLIVAVTTIILACTNLPREIENRVIYSIATKPATRLDIVLGKVFGFAQVSFIILLIMGACAWGYMALRAWSMNRWIAQRLETPDPAAPTSVATLQYYRQAGLLNAKRLEQPAGLQVYGRLPRQDDPRRYVYGSGEGSFLVPFMIDPAAITPPGAPAPAPQGLVVMAELGYVRRGDGDATTRPAAAEPPATQPATQAAAQAAGTQPATRPYYGPFVMSPEERQAVMGGGVAQRDPTVNIEITDANQNVIASATPIGPLKVLALPNDQGLSRVGALVPPDVAGKLKGLHYIRVTGQAEGVDYYVDTQQTPDPVRLVAPMGQGVQPLEILSARSGATPAQPAPLIFQSRAGTFGQQLRGHPTRPPVAIFRFSGADVRPADGRVSFEFRTGIERSLIEEPGAPDYAGATRVAVQVRKTGAPDAAEEVVIEPESNRPIVFSVPAAAGIDGGDFEVLVRCLSPGDFIGLNPRTIVAITAVQPFAWNLFKSMTILWLLSVLITTVAIFTSTFLSWPIAVIFTLVILSAHWVVQQLGDSLQPGVGAAFVTDLQVKDPAKAAAMRESVEKLSWFLNFVSSLLPDISRYAAVEDIERGVSIPWIKVQESLFVTLGFGIPLVLLAYLFLKHKEVAP